MFFPMFSRHAMRLDLKLNRPALARPPLGELRSELRERAAVRDGRPNLTYGHERADETCCR